MCRFNYGSWCTGAPLLNTSDAQHSCRMVFSCFACGRHSLHNRILIGAHEIGGLGLLAIFFYFLLAYMGRRFGHECIRGHTHTHTYGCIQKHVQPRVDARASPPRHALPRMRAARWPAPRGMRAENKHTHTRTTDANKPEKKKKRACKKKNNDVPRSRGCRAPASQRTKMDTAMRALCP